MSSKQLIADVAESAGITQAAARKVLDAIAESTTRQLKEGFDVTLPGLGKVKPVAKASRTGRNPKTGEAVEIPAHTAVKFSPASTLKEAVA